MKKCLLHNSVQPPLSRDSVKAKFIQIIKHSEDFQEERVQGVNSLSSTTRFRPSIRETKPPRLPINELGKWEIFYLGLAGGAGGVVGGTSRASPPRAPPCALHAS
ncbi:hypothetical protein EVAR_58102_1 [Eumeta japonica]|uniref:Uncharacterized protein n=1 Tax=Eumeta variegata TaxID=151549 RepID=A0A4C1YK72_EUMVA|nr:hypothetical protein EVAR_58102_1 [Eumeta japonica]